MDELEYIANEERKKVSFVGRQVTNFEIKDDWLILELDGGITKITIHAAKIEYQPGPEFLKLVTEYLGTKYLPLP